MIHIGGYLKDPLDQRDEKFSWSQRGRQRVAAKKTVSLWDPSYKIKEQLYQDCTGFAGSYALRMAIHRATWKDPGNLSGLFLYYTGRAVWNGTDEDAGSYLRTLFSAIQVQGACLEELFPSNQSPFLAPRWKHIKNAFKHRGIRRYRQIKTPEEAREALSDGVPLVGGWDVGDDFENWKGGAPFRKETSTRGGHAMAVSGYEKDHFIIPNSWGPTVGIQGFWHVHEDFLAANTVLYACDTKGA